MHAEEQAVSPPLSPPPVIVRQAHDEGFERVRRPARENFLIVLLALLSLLAAVLFLPLALVTFWAVFSTLARLLGMPPGQEWPLSGAVTAGLLTAAGVGYLLVDRVVMFGTSHARALLEENALRLHGAPLPETRFFVLLGGKQSEPRLRVAEDSGWLLFYRERLEFVGDRLLVTVPKAQVMHLELGPDVARLGLGSRWLILLLQPNARGRAGRLRFQSRDGDGLAATSQGAKRLETALQAWLTTDA